MKDVFLSWNFLQYIRVAFRNIHAAACIKIWSNRMVDNITEAETNKKINALETDDIRAGRKVSYMPWILGISTIAAVLVLFFVFAGFAA